MVERELGRVAGAIDRIEGRMKFLSDRARMSTITVEFTKKVSDSVSGRPVNLPIHWLHQMGLGRLLSL